MVGGTTTVKTATALVTAPGGDIDDADYLVRFLGGDDLSAVRGEEDVIGTDEGLARPQIPGAWELPEHATVRINDHQTVVVLVRDDDRDGKHPRI